MEINLTFFVQALHFFFAYAIIDRLLCRSTISVIEHDQKRYTDALQALKDQETKLKEKEDTKRLAWLKIQETTASSFPSLAFHKPSFDFNVDQTRVSERKALYADHFQKLHKRLLQRLSHVS